ncbi:MAG: response regulator transcription factor [Chloroflexota bacterium]
MYRILVVDDDPNIVRLVRTYLEQANYTVLTASNGHKAQQVLKQERPDLLILDLMLPDKDGWEIAREIRADSQLKATPIIMLTARVDDTDKIVGLEIGADDYITKPFNTRELVARVRSLLRRLELDKEEAPSSGVVTVSHFRLDIGRHLVYVRDELIDITPTEFDLLQLFLENPGYVFTRDELIEKGLGYSYVGLGRSLDSHIKNLRKKIEDDPKKPNYLLTVYGIGYKFMKG